MNYSLNFAIINSMEFVTWINQVFSNWRGSSRRTVSDFAKFIGVKQPVMSDWLNGKIKSPPSSESISKIADKFPEVYQILGMSIPQQSIDLDNLPPKYQYIRTAINEASRQIRARNIPNDSDEAEEIVKEVFAQYGMTYKYTTKGG